MRGIGENKTEGPRQSCLVCLVPGTEALVEEGGPRERTQGVRNESIGENSGTEGKSTAEQRQTSVHAFLPQVLETPSSL